MTHLRTYAIALVLFVLGHSSALAQQQTLSWNWANTVCGDMLNCNTGCSACNQPADFLPNFYGINAAWLGLNTCPQTTTTGDNAVFSEEWSAAPDPLKMVMIAGIATGPMDLDNIMIRHRSDDQGPTWLRVSLKLDLSKPAILIHEGPITEGFTSLVLSDLGKLDIPAGYTAAGFQLQLQAFGGDGGAWVLDAVHVSASPSTPDMTTGLTDLIGKPNGKLDRVYDVLGRPAGDLSGLGISRDGKRRVVVQ